MTELNPEQVAAIRRNWRGPSYDDEIALCDTVDALRAKQDKIVESFNVSSKLALEMIEALREDLREVQEALDRTKTHCPACGWPRDPRGRGGAHCTCYGLGEADDE
jgi:hypothetical protein